MSNIATKRLRGFSKSVARAIAVSLAVTAGAAPALAAPYAAMVMDARNGEIYYSENAETPLHPASLTKMLTLYIAFEAVRRGELSMQSEVTVSSRAANEVPSKLGLKAGQKIALEHLVRAAAVKSANDAATAIAEAVSGSVEAFSDRMNRTARAIGMTRSYFTNAHGLTEDGHYSTARDMTVLGRQLYFDYPEYYSLFSDLEADAGVATVKHTNSRFLTSYPGADGIKTGYTNASGFSMVASAARGSERMIGTVIGAASSADRTEKVSDLLTWGFDLAPSQVTLMPPAPPKDTGEDLYAAMPHLSNSQAPKTASPVNSLGITFQDLARRRTDVIDQTDLETIGVGRKSARSLLPMNITDLAQHQTARREMAQSEGFVAPIGMEVAHAGVRYYLKTGIKPGQPRPPRHRMHDVTRFAFGRNAAGQIVITDDPNADPSLERLQPRDIFNVATAMPQDMSPVASGPFSIPRGNPHTVIETPQGAIFNATLFQSPTVISQPDVSLTGKETADAKKDTVHEDDPRPARSAKKLLE